MNKLAMILLYTFSVQAWAAEPVAVPQSAVPQQAVGTPDAVAPGQTTATSKAADVLPADEANMLDAPRDYVSQKFVGWVSDLDRFFGNERNFQESNQSVLQLDFTKVSGYGGDKKVVLSGRAKVHLPSTEKRLHLLIESDPDKNTSGEQPPVQTTKVKEVAAPSSYAAALRYEKEPENRWLFSTDAGVKFQGLNTSPFARARASYATPLERWRVKFTETPFWFNNLGVGASTQLDFERPLSEPVLFRASSIATWLHDKQNFDMRQDVSVYHTLDERRALLYQASALGASQPQFHASDYVLLVLYRYRLHQKWMFLEVSPQLHYPQAMRYHVSPSLSLRLEVLFDGVK